MKKTASRSADISRALSRFSSVRRLMRARIADGRNLDMAAWLRIEALKFISLREAPHAKDLASHLAITAPSATSLIRGLVRRGLVERRIDPQDRRAARLALTRKGKRALEDTIARGTELLSPLFASFSDRELAEFIRALDAILEAGR